MKKNIALIGMPGSGKTVIGRFCAQKLKLDFCDLDEYIEKESGEKISEIFKNGEEYFRNIETESLNTICSRSNLIISTGGGIIKKECNLEILKENSIIIFINRSPKDIVSDVDIKTRPLLANGASSVFKLYDERIDIYKNSCDYEIINNKDLTYVCSKIIKIYKKEL